jgi:hypothetical protein
MGRLEALPTHGNGFVMAVFQGYGPRSPLTGSKPTVLDDWPMRRGSPT